MAKDILRTYCELQKEEQQLLQEIERIEAKIESTGVTVSDVNSARRKTDKTAKYAVLLAETNEMLKAKQVEIAGELKRIHYAINMVDNSLYRRILREYYLNGKKWEQVAVDLGYSIHHIWRLHGEALREIRLTFSSKPVL